MDFVLLALAPPLPLLTKIVISIVMSFFASGLVASGRKRQRKLVGAFLAASIAATLVIALEFSFPDPISPGLDGRGLLAALIGLIVGGVCTLALSNRHKRVFRYFVFAVLGLVVTGLVVSWLVAGWLAAPQPSAIGAPPSDLPAMSISLASDSDTTVAGWHIPSESQQGVIVLLHPIRGSRKTMLERARFLHAAGYSIVMIDLQAHGESPGKQITLGYLERHDARAAVEFARRTHPDEPIGVLGVSLGGAAALLSSPLGIDALVLESVYPSIDHAVHNRVATKIGLFSSIPAELLLVQLKPRLGVSSSQLRPIDCLANADCPVFLISGTEDRYTTATEAKEMFSRTPSPKELWLIDGAAHIDLYRASPVEYKTRIIRFFKQQMRK